MRRAAAVYSNGAAKEDEAPLNQATRDDSIRRRQLFRHGEADFSRDRREYVPVTRGPAALVAAGEMLPRPFVCGPRSLQ
jgi:hypothetical protein